VRARERKLDFPSSRSPGISISRFHLVYAEGHHHHLDNCAFGGPDLKTIYITEALSGDVLMARMPVAGKRMFGLS
jgi:hypothetical protein